MRTGNSSITVRPAARPRLARGGGLTSARRPNPYRWLLLLLVPLVAGILGLVWLNPPEPQALAGFALAGDRSPACVRTIVFRDQSGSMQGFEAARESAMEQLLAWGAGPHALRDDDEFAIVDFAADGVVAMPTTAVADLGPSVPGNAALDTGGSDLAPGILALDGLAASTCTTSLIVLSDGLISPLSSAAVRELAEQGVTSVALVLPGSMPTPQDWSSEFPYGLVVAASADDADQTARAVGEAVAASVGQRLEPR